MNKKEFSLIALALRAYFPRENNLLPKFGFGFVPALSGLLLLHVLDKTK